MVDPSACDSCGAMLPLPDAEGHVTCLSCGRQERVSKLPPPPADGADLGIPGIGTPRVTVHHSAATVDLKKASGCVKGGIVGFIVVFFVLPVLAVLLVVLVVAFVPDSGSSNSTGPTGNVIVLDVLDTTPASDTSRITTVVALVQETSGSSYDRYLSVIALPQVDARENWRSEALGQNATNVRVASGGMGIVAVVEDRLLRFDGTGKMSWEATLPDVISGACTTCLVQVGSSIVVQTADGEVQAYGGGSSERRWTRTLEASNGAIAVAGEHLVVMDEPADGDPYVEIVDPATGKASGRAPTPCADQHSGIRTTVTPIPGDDAVLLLAGYSSACAARYDAATGTIGPDLPLPQELYVDATTEDTPIFVGNEVTLPVRDAVALLDLTSGAVRQLPVPAGLKARPSSAVDGKLLATTSSTRGTPVGGIAAWDLASGELEWSTELADRAQLLELDPTFGDTVFPDEARAALGRDGDRPTVVTFAAGDPSTVSVAAVDLATGEIGPATSQTIEDDAASSFSVSLVDTGPERLVFLVDWQLVGLDANGDGTPVTFPS